MTTNAVATNIKNSLEGEIAEHRPRLRSYIRGRVTTREDADDILQDVMLQLVRTVEGAMNPIENISAWLYRVARNTIINSRIKKREETIPEGLAPVGDDDVMGGMLREFVWEELEAALSELPPEQREIFEMTELEGVPVRAISEASGIPIATLNSRKHYAVLWLRERLKGVYDELIYG